MLKWLAISGVVFMGFMVILLGLGYLLQENEKSTTALKQQLDQQRYTEQQRQLKRIQAKLKTEPIEIEPLVLDKKHKKTALLNSSQLSIGNSSQKKRTYQQIITENLTCVSSEQCLVITLDFANLSCQIATNSIGAAKLAKAGVTNMHIDQCSHYLNDVMAQCITNLCTLTTKTP